MSRTLLLRAGRRKLDVSDANTFEYFELGITRAWAPLTQASIVSTSAKLEPMEQTQPNADAGTRVQFVENGHELTAVEVGRSGRSPVIARIHRALFAIGVVVSAYQVRALPGGTVERIVLQRRDGSAVSGELGALTRAAILPIALDAEANET